MQQFSYAGLFGHNVQKSVTKQVDQPQPAVVSKRSTKKKKAFSVDRKKKSIKTSWSNPWRVKQMFWIIQLKQTFLVNFRLIIAVIVRELVIQAPGLRLSQRLLEASATATNNVCTRLIKISIAITRSSKGILGGGGLGGWHCTTMAVDCMLQWSTSPNHTGQITACFI